MRAPVLCSTTALALTLVLAAGTPAAGLDFSGHGLFHQETYVGELAYPTSPETDAYCAGGLEGSLGLFSVGATLNGTTAHVDIPNGFVQTTHLVMGSLGPEPTATIGLRGAFDNLAFVGPPDLVQVAVAAMFDSAFPLGPSVFGGIDYIDASTVDLLVSEGGVPPLVSSRVALDASARAALLSGPFTIDLFVDRSAGLAVASVDIDGYGVVTTAAIPLSTVTALTDYYGALQGVFHSGIGPSSVVADFTSLEQYVNPLDQGVPHTLGLDFSGGGPLAPFTPAVGGWAFSVCHPVDVTALGIWDEGADGLANDHEIGLWNADGSVLLASVPTTLPTFSRPSALSGAGEWLFIAIDPVQLAPGSYLLGATYQASDADVIRLQATAETAAEITYLETRSIGSASLEAPLNTDPGNENGFFGPNLLVNEAPEAVPSLGPTALAMLGLLIAALATRFLPRR
jgi:hypothetical protein